MNEDTFATGNDPLSTALMKIKLRAFLNVALDAGGTWGVDFPALEGFTLNVVRKGECWLAIQGHAERVRLRAGDCFLLTGGKEFTLTNDLSLKKRVGAPQLYAVAKDGTAVVPGGRRLFRHRDDLSLRGSPAVDPVRTAAAGHSHRRRLRRGRGPALEPGTLRRGATRRWHGTHAHARPSCSHHAVADAANLSFHGEEGGKLVGRAVPPATVEGLRCDAIGLWAGTGRSKSWQISPTCRARASRSCSRRKWE